MLASSRKVNGDGYDSKPHSRDVSVERLSISKPEPYVARVFGFSRKRSAMPVNSGVTQRQSLSPLASGKRIEVENLQTNDLIVAIMGSTGAGKSSFINMVVSGQEDHSASAVTVGHTLQSCTSDLAMVRLVDPTTGSRVVFVDTPGFGQTPQADSEILDMISQWLKQIYKKDVKLAGILYLHKISDNRVANTPTPLTNISLFEKLCGKQALRNVVLGTTMWDLIDEEEGIQREQELQQKYWRGMLKGGSKTFRYYRSQESAWSIVQHFLPPELIQRKTTPPPESRAGAKVSTRVEGLLGQQQATMDKLEQEMFRHSEEVNLLREEFKSQQEALRKLLQEMKEL